MGEVDHAGGPLAAGGVECGARGGGDRQGGEGGLVRPVREQAGCDGCGQVGQGGEEGAQGPREAAEGQQEEENLDPAGGLGDGGSHQAAQGEARQGEGMRPSADFAWARPRRATFKSPLFVWAGCIRNSRTRVSSSSSGRLIRVSLLRRRVRSIAKKRTFPRGSFWNLERWRPS